jgi:hypothetical protein
MLIPLLLLSVGAVFAGFVFHGAFIEPTAGESYWHGASPSTSISCTTCILCRCG